MRPHLTLHDPTTARTYYEQGLWTSDTFYSLLRKHANNMPSAKALRDGRIHLDWRSLKARVDALADDFIEREIGAGDRVSIWMSNRVEAIVTFLACSRVGAACNPSLHRTFTCAEVIDMLTELQVSALVTEDGWGADADRHDMSSMLERLPFLKKVYKPTNMPLYITQLQETYHANSDTVSYLAFTSGTTGRPKCVMHSSNTILANARDLSREWKISGSDVILTLSPLSHHIAWVAVGQWLVIGAELVVDDPPSGLSRLDWIIETNASYVLGVPTHAMDILAEQQLRGIKDLGSVRIFYMAGAPIPDAIARAFSQQGISPQNVYGMTENSSHQFTHPGDPLNIAVSTCGRGGRSYEVKIWDPENIDRELPQGATGEIGGRGAALMLGYFGDQRSTEQVFNKHGYMMSGDLGSLDALGNLRIEGRLKDVIIRGGHNIYPSRIEAMALTHPNISGAAVFPVRNDRLGEQVCLATIGKVSSSDLLKHLAQEGLSKFDMPEWHVAMESFPLTTSGKVLKRRLIEMAGNAEITPLPVRFQARNKR
ncbi:class I adenylate-forming enzyme family protein [Ochrobactrum quorumnocens]|nr:class I adenylate-forming enzyme family protein [[Ochrobactrum] quorumnocens]